MEDAVRLLAPATLTPARERERNARRKAGEELRRNQVFDKLMQSKVKQIRADRLAVVHSRWPSPRTLIWVAAILVLVAAFASTIALIAMAGQNDHPASPPSPPAAPPLIPNSITALSVEYVAASNEAAVSTTRAQWESVMSPIFNGSFVSLEEAGSVLQLRHVTAPAVALTAACGAFNSTVSGVLVWRTPLASAAVESIAASALTNATIGSAVLCSLSLSTDRVLSVSPPTSPPTSSSLPSNPPPSPPSPPHPPPRPPLLCPTGTNPVHLTGGPSGLYQLCYSTTHRTWDAAYDFCAAGGMRMLELSSEAKMQAWQAVYGTRQTWLGLVCRDGPGSCNLNVNQWSWNSGPNLATCDLASGFSPTWSGVGNNEQYGHYWGAVTRLSAAHSWSNFDTVCELDDGFAEGCNSTFVSKYAAPSPPPSLPPPMPATPVPGGHDLLGSCFSAEIVNQGAGNYIGNQQYATYRDAALACLTTYASSCKYLQFFQGNVRIKDGNRPPFNYNGAHHRTRAENCSMPPAPAPPSPPPAPPPPSPPPSPAYPPRAPIVAYHDSGGAASTAKTFMAAKAACEAMGAVLSYPHNPSEAAAYRAAWSTDNSRWVGAWDPNGDGNWISLSGFAPLPYKRWHFDEPSTPNGTCKAAYKNYSDGEYWFTDACDATTRRYVCQGAVDPPSNPTPSMPTPSPPPPSPPPPSPPPASGRRLSRRAAHPNRDVDE